MRIRVHLSLILLIIALLFSLSTSIEAKSLGGEISIIQSNVTDFTQFLRLSERQKNEVIKHKHNLSRVNYTLYRASFNIFSEYAKQIDQIYRDHPNYNEAFISIFLDELKLRELLLKNEPEKIKSLLDSNAALERKYKSVLYATDITILSENDFVIAWSAHSKVNECSLEDANLNILCNYLFLNYEPTNNELNALIEYRNNKKIVSRSELIEGISTINNNLNYFNLVKQWHTDILFSKIIELVLIREMVKHGNSEPAFFNAHLLRINRDRSNNKSEDDVLKDFLKKNQCGKITDPNFDRYIGTVSPDIALRLMVTLGSCYSHSQLQSIFTRSINQVLSNIERALKSQNVPIGIFSILDEVSWSLLNISELSSIYRLTKSYNPYFHSGTTISRELYSAILYVQFVNRTSETAAVTYTNNMRMIVEFLTNDSDIWFAPRLLFALQVITMPELRESLTTRLN